MESRGEVGLSDSLDLKVIRSNGTVDYPFVKSMVPDNPDFPLAMLLTYGAPQRGLSEEVNSWRRANFGRLLKGWNRARRHVRKGIATFVDSLSLVVIRSDGEIVDLGLASIDLVVTAGANFIRDSFLNTQENENLKFHALGTGTTAPVIGNTGMETEWTGSEYTGGVRPSGNYTSPQSKRAQSVATNTKANAGTSAVTELGILSSATIGAGTLLARFTFAAVNLAQNDALQSTFNLDINDGG